MTKGTVVTINFGPFAGLSGVVISSSPQRTVVRIVIKGRSILVELDTHMILREKLLRSTQVSRPPRSSGN